MLAQQIRFKCVLRYLQSDSCGVCRQADKLEIFSCAE